VYSGPAKGFRLVTIRPLPPQDGQADRPDPWHLWQRRLTGSDFGPRYLRSNSIIKGHSSSHTLSRWQYRSEYGEKRARLGRNHARNLHRTCRSDRVYEFAPFSAANVPCARLDHHDRRLYLKRSPRKGPPFRDISRQGRAGDRATPKWRARHILQNGRHVPTSDETLQGPALRGRCYVSLTCVVMAGSSCLAVGTASVIS